MEWLSWAEDRKKDNSAQKAVHYKNSDAQLRCLAEIIPEGIIFCDKDGKITFINSALEKTLGLEYDQVVGSHCRDLPWHSCSNASEKNASGNSLFEHVMKTGLAINGQDYIWETTSGQTVVFSVNATPYLNENGDLDGVVASMMETASGRQAEIGANEIKEIYERLTSYADEALFRIRFSDAKIIYINEAAEKILGYSLDDYSAMPDIYKKFILPEYYTRWLHASEDIIKGKDFIKHLVIGITAKDGRTVMMEFTVITVKDQRGKIVYIEALARDITSRGFLELELAKAQKLESIGLLAGGIAHDFNNILTAILGSISLAKIEANSPTAICERLTRAEENCLKAKSLTNRLLSYSRGGGLTRKPSSLAKVLQEAADFAVSGKNSKCKFSFPNGLWFAQIDEGQIQQVVHYLVANATEAMPDGGTIEIGAQNMHVKINELPPLTAGNYVKWYVKDHGVGISEENMRNLFDPYFTTKPMGNTKGLGLGLAICYSIVKNHEGLITVNSEPGAGTTINVYIPALTEEINFKIPDTNKKIKTTDKYKILLIDDEKILLDVTSSMLIHLGYEVATAQSHDQALDIYGKAKDAGQPFSLIIIDLTVRGDESGKTAIQRWLTIHPEVKAVISSGYVHDPVIEEYWKYGFAGSILKPYTLADLEKALEKIIAKG